MWICNDKPGRIKWLNRDYREAGKFGREHQRHRRSFRNIESAFSSSIFVVISPEN